MLISPTSGGIGQQTSGNPSAPSAGNGIFAALLGNQPSQSGIAELSENVLNALVNNSPANVETPGALSAEILASLASGSILEETASLDAAPTANLVATETPGALANIADQTGGKAVSNPAAANLASGQQLQAPVTENANIVLQQIVEQGVAVNGKEAQGQNSKHAAGAQAAEALTASGLRPTSLTRENAQNNTSQFGNREASASPSQSGTALMANPGAGAKNANAHALFHSDIVTAFGAQGIERPDTVAANNNFANNMMPIRATAAMENYTQQMRLAGDEVKAPARTLAVEISNNAQAGIKRFEIRMDPPELGRIDVRLEIKENGSVTTRLVVERAETLDLLQRDARLIERTLNDNGLKTEEGGIRMSLKNDGSGQQAQNGANGSEQNEQSSDTAPETTILVLNEDFDGLPPSHQLMAEGRLDISV